MEKLTDILSEKEPTKSIKLKLRTLLWEMESFQIQLARLSSGEISGLTQDEINTQKADTYRFLQTKTEERDKFLLEHAEFLL